MLTGAPRAAVGALAARLGLAMLGQVEPEVEAGLEQDQDQHGCRRRAGHRDRQPADDDRQVEDDEPAVRRAHLRADARPQVLAAADVVEAVRDAVADEQPDEDERDRERVDRDAGALAAERLELRQGQHEDAVDDPEDAVVDDEERDERRLGRAPPTTGRPL